MKSSIARWYVNCDGKTLLVCCVSR